MKTLLAGLVLSFFAQTLCAQGLILDAKSIKPYLAIVKTKYGREKGILYKVDSADVVIDTYKKLKTINFSEIKWIKLRVLKDNDKDFIKFVKYDPWSKDNYETVGNGILVRKWGEKDPTTNEEIAGHIGATAINVAGNLLAIPIQSINPSIANFNIDTDRTKYLDRLTDLIYYTISYQLNPNVAAELKAIQEISAKSKN